MQLFLQPILALCNVGLPICRYATLYAIPYAIALPNRFSFHDKLRDSERF